MAIERSVELRDEHIERMGTKYTADQLVFVDESSCDRRTSIRNTAWAVRGERAVRKTFFVRGRRFVF